MAQEPLAGLQVLVLDDEALLRRRLAASLAAWGAEVTQVGACAEAERALRELDFDLVLLDVHLPDGRGTDLLRAGRVPEATVAIVMTAEGGVSGAVEAMRLGAADYLVKPFDLEELPVRIERARRSMRKRRAEEFHERAAAPAEALFFGPSLQQVEGQVRKILEADRRCQGPLPPVLIEGETGTGKTTLARWVHRQGPRAGGPLIEVNCSALPEALAESELFGHERGAFTDAAKTRIGLMEAAEGGTLFLDEVPSLAPALQAKLLTAIEDRMVRRVGASRAKPVDVRIIAASNADLRARVADGRFRADLFQRLDLFRLRLPPLRERGDDVLELAARLAQQIAARYGIKVGAIPAEGRRRLLAYPWPGNIRELAHEIERAVVFDAEDGLHFRALGGGDAQAATAAPAVLPPGFTFPESGFSLESVIDQIVRQALEQAGGNVSAAARMLGVTRDYVRYRLKQSSGPGSGA